MKCALFRLPTSKTESDGLHLTRLLRSFLASALRLTALFGVDRGLQRGEAILDLLHQVERKCLQIVQDSFSVHHPTSVQHYREGEVLAPVLIEGRRGHKLTVLLV